MNRLIKIIFIFYTFIILFILLPFFLLGNDLQRNTLPTLNNQLVIKSWGTDSGLHQNLTTMIYQTKKGYIFLGNQESIARFDGTNFKYYKHNYKNRYTLCMLEDSDETLYFGTLGHGLIKFKGEKTTQFNTENSNIRNNIISSLATGPNNSILIGTDKGLFIIKNNKIKEVEIKYKNKIHFPRINAIKYIKEKNITYLGTSIGFIILKNNKTNIIPKEDLSKDQEINDIEYDDLGFIWLGTRSGLIKKNKQYKTIKSYTIKEGLKNNVVLTLNYKKGYGLLIGTEKGVSIYKNNKIITLSQESLDIGPVHSALIDKEGNYWIGGDSIRMFYLGNIINLTVKKDKHVWALCEMDNGEVWQGTRKGIYKIKNNQIIGEVSPFKDIKIRAIFMDNNKNIWIGTENGAYCLDREEKIICYLGNKDGLKSNLIKCFAQDDKNNLWVGTRNGLTIFKKNKLKKIFGVKDGLPNATINNLFFDKKTKNMYISTEAGFCKIKDDVITKISGSKKFTDTICCSILKDNSNYLWVSTYNGVTVLKDDKPLYTFDTKDGLLNKFIYQLVKDQKGNLWMSSNEGISFIKKQDLIEKIKNPRKELKFTHLNESDGMRRKECNGGNHCCGLADKKGLIYFATVEGVCIINPIKYKKIDNEFNIYIDNISIDGKIKKKLSNSNIPFVIEKDKNRVNFNISKVCFRRPEAVELEYILEGFDKNPIINDKTNIVYTNLPPNIYKFTVSGKNFLTGEHKQSLIIIEKEPKFYQTIYFKILSFISIILTTWIVSLIKNHRLNVKRNELEKLVAIRTQELKNATLKDQLTGLYNRRYMTEVIDNEVTNFLALKNYSLKNNTNNRKVDKFLVYGLVLIDIDNFKKINDTYGHNSGDMILRQISSVLKRSIRKEDAVIRWGGEEFIVLLKKTKRRFLTVYAKKILSMINDLDYEIEGDKKIKVSCSGGLMGFPVYDKYPNMFNFDQAIKLVDSALYHSKNNGRNRYTILSPTDKICEEENITNLTQNLKWANKNSYLNITVISGKDTTS